MHKNICFTGDELGTDCCTPSTFSNLWMQRVLLAGWLGLRVCRRAGEEEPGGLAHCYLLSTRHLTNTLAAFYLALSKQEPSRG